jgi:hypothetical protein
MELGLLIRPLGLLVRPLGMMDPGAIGEFFMSLGS